MTLAPADFRDLGCLLNLGLRPNDPTDDRDENQRLLRRYQEEPEFRSAADSIAAGFRLQVLAVDSLGMVLAPEEGSAFALRASDYPASRRESSDDRLIDGLIHVAILATVFPRAEDLEMAASVVRAPITVAEVEATLRDLCARLAGESRARSDSPDAPADAAATGLREAWRAYVARPEAVTTEDGRAYPRATPTRIENALKFLRGQGAFRRVGRGEPAQYQAAWRYHVLVQDFAADRMAAAVREMLRGEKIALDERRASPAAVPNPKEDD